MITYTPDPDFTGTVKFTYTITDNKGNFSTAEVTVVVKPHNASLGDRVWNDKNKDGIQDLFDEPGIEGVTVNLIDPSSENEPGQPNVIATVKTDQFGNYRFNNLSPGDYAIQVELPEGFATFSPPNIDSEDIDSDIIEFATGVSDVFSLSANQQETRLDAGLIEKPARLGNFIWRDLNGDGIQDPNEPGIEGISISLLEPLTNIDLGLPPAVTDQDGFYLSIGLWTKLRHITYRS